MIVLGIDPGASGAIVALSMDVEQRTVTMFKLSQTEADIAVWLEGLCDQVMPHAFIERVHSMPKQGVSSSFKFGQSYGFLRGLLCGFAIPFEEVSPQKWQREMGCLTGGKKNVSKQKAQQLFPREKITHATADALLIAEYGRRVLKQRYGAT